MRAGGVSPLMIPARDRVARSGGLRLPARHCSAVLTLPRPRGGRSVASRRTTRKSPRPTRFSRVCRLSTNSCRPPAMTSSACVYASSARSWPKPLFGQVAEAARATCRRSRAAIRWPASGSAARPAGNSRSSTRKSTTFDRRNPAVPLAVHLKRAGRSQQGRPLDVVERRADVGQLRQQDEVLHVENARRLIGPLEHRGPAGRSARLRRGSSWRR